MRHFILVTIVCGMSFAAPVLWLQSDIASHLAEETGVSNDPETRSGNRPLIIRSFSYTSLNEHGIDNTLEADKLEIKPRRFMAFNINSINEAVVNNARLAVYTREDMDAVPQYFGFEDVIPLPGDEENRMGRGGVLGLVTRMVLNGMVMDMFRDNSRIITLAASTGLVEKKNGDLRAFNATLTDVRSSRRIKTRKLLWDSKRKTFLIPGPYTMNTSSGKVSGSSVEVDLDFMITPLNS